MSKKYVRIHIKSYLTFMKILGRKGSNIALFLFFLRSVDEDGYYFGSYEKISKITGISKATVGRAIKSLIELGLLIQEQTGVWRIPSDKMKQLMEG